MAVPRVLKCVKKGFKYLGKVFCRRPQPPSKRQDDDTTTRTFTVLTGGVVGESSQSQETVTIFPPSSVHVHNYGTMADSPPQQVSSGSYVCHMSNTVNNPSLFWAEPVTAVESSSSWSTITSSLDHGSPAVPAPPTLNVPRRRLRHRESVSNLAQALSAANPPTTGKAPFTPPNQFLPEDSGLDLTTGGTTKDTFHGHNHLRRHPRMNKTVSSGLVFPAQAHDPFVEHGSSNAVSNPFSSSPPNDTGSSPGSNADGNNTAIPGPSTAPAVAALPRSTSTAQVQTKITFSSNGDKRPWDSFDSEEFDATNAPVYLGNGQYLLADGEQHNIAELAPRPGEYYSPPGDKTSPPIREVEVANLPPMLMPRIPPDVAIRNATRNSTVVHPMILDLIDNINVHQHNAGANLVRAMRAEAREEMLLAQLEDRDAEILALQNPSTTVSPPRPTRPRSL